MKLIQQHNRNLLRGLFIFFTFFTALAGRGERVPAQQTPTQPGDSVQRMTVGGLQRTYRLHIPTGYDGSKALPLVFVLHGAGGNGVHMESLTGFSAKADSEHFLVVYPNGTGNPQMWATAMSPHPYSTADDVGFIRAILNRLEHDLKVDHQRVFCCGFSMGGMMTYRLGAEMSDRFAAIGVASGTIGTKQPDGTVYEISNPTYPLPLIAFHGKHDPVVGYFGNGTYAQQPDYVLPVATSIGFWVNRDGCNTSPQETTKQNSNLIIDDYSHCQGTNEVILYSFGNGTHEWPTLQNNDHFSATEAIWEFFMKHPKP